MRPIAIIIVLLTIISTLDSFAGGTGTPFDPYLVETAEHLDAVRNHLSAHFRQIAHIDMSAYLAPGGAGYNGGAGWEPIGHYTTPFTGSYDGDRNIISNLFIEREQEGYVGLFGYTGENSNLCNIFLEDVDISGDFAAPLAFNVKGNVSNCYSTGTVYGTIAAGGLIGETGNFGHNSPIVVIENSYSSCEVRGLITAGGLIVFSYNTLVINCHATGYVRGGWYSTGGLIAEFANSTVENSSATGNVSSNSYSVGGLIGLAMLSGIHNCFATGDIVVITTDWSSAGGLLGISEEMISITNSYSTGNISLQSSLQWLSFAGGLVGSSSGVCIIYYCYSTGRVYNEGGCSGGLIGSSHDTSYVAYSYWDIFSSGINHSALGIAKITPEMLQQSTYPNWNFNSVWQIEEGFSYPYLINNPPSEVPAPPQTAEDLGALTVSGPPVVFQDNVCVHQITVFNMGSNPQSNFLVRLIKGDEVVVGETIVSTLLNQYEQTNVEISWIPLVTEHTYLRGEVILDGDENSLDNITFEFPLKVYPGFEYGTGTPCSPYQISTIDHLYLARYFPESHYEMTADIDAAAFGVWRPIGYYQTEEDNLPFTGSFNGNGHTISNLVFQRRIHYSLYYGLFGYTGEESIIQNVVLSNFTASGNNLKIGSLSGLNRGTIENVTVNGFTLHEKVTSFGGLVNQNEGVIVNCSVSFSAAIVSPNARAGGLAEINRGEIINSNSTVTMTGVQTLGGIAARNETEGIILNCLSSANLTSTQIVGGITAQNYGSIRKSYSLNSSINGYDRVGGLTGANYALIEDCFSSGNVAGEYRVGGLSGKSQGTIINSYSQSSVNGFRYIGGLTGRTSSVNVIQNSYSTGRVIGVFDRGGLIGLNYGTVESSYWDRQTSGQANSDGGEGKTTVEMKQTSTFTGWDFESVWEIIENESYPFLYYQEGPLEVEEKELPLPQSTELIGNFPNPFNPGTTIHFYLNEEGVVQLEIFNIRGQRVRKLLNEHLNRGEQQVIWNGKDDRGNSVAGGVYIYRLKRGSLTLSRKMLLLK